VFLPGSFAMAEGYIKFHAVWDKGNPVAPDFLADLIATRQRLFQLGLIGAGPDGVGYGNISKRYDARGRFVISGTATGHLETLGPEHFSLVAEADIPANKVYCTGPALASSESMSHAAVYQTCPEINAVIHIHDSRLWERWIGRAPTTPGSATYGTPEMAFSIMELLADPVLREWKFIVMGGHPEGCIFFGKNLPEAFDALWNRSKDFVF